MGLEEGQFLAKSQNLERTVRSGAEEGDDGVEKGLDPGLIMARSVLQEQEVTGCKVLIAQPEKILGRDWGSAGSI